MVDGAELVRFLGEFRRETDRAAAVLGAAYLDTHLEVLLREKFVAQPEFVKSLFKGQGGLSTFSEKISICYAVGLMSRRASDNQNIVRKIRNVFAHEPLGISFKTQEIVKLVNKFTRDDTEIGKGAVTLPKDARQRFNTAVSFLLLNGIDKSMRDIPKLKEPPRSGWSHV